MLNNKCLLKQEFTHEVCCALLPEWKGANIEIIQLSGGITNKLPHKVGKG